MALPHWMNITLRLVSNVTSFLLNDPPSECPLASLSHEERYRNSDSSAGILDAALSFVATSVGLDLTSYTLTVVDSLSVATAFLLRLTENVPAEVLLFLIVSGAVFWLIRRPSLWGVEQLGYLVFCCCISHGEHNKLADQLSVLNDTRKHQVLFHCLPLSFPRCLTLLRLSSQQQLTHRCTTRSRRGRQAWRPENGRLGHRGRISLLVFDVAGLPYLFIHTPT